MVGFGTRKDGRVYPKHGLGFDTAERIADPSDVRVIASAPSTAGRQLSLYAEGEDSSDEAVRKRCVRCGGLTKYAMGSTPVCRKCYQEV